MKTLALILTILSGGEEGRYIIDNDMSGADCIEALIERSEYAAELGWELACVLEIEA